MNLTLDSKTIRTHPAFASPLRVGVLAHLAAFAAPVETKNMETSIAPLCFFVSPAALAATLSASRSQIENAIVDLCKHELIRVDKHQGKRGEWLIDMTKCASMLVGDDGAEPPKEVPIRDLMNRWDELYEKKNEYKYVRSRSDYWKELGDWNQLYQTLEDQIFVAMERYFDDIRFKQWGYAFKVFFKSAPQLAKQDQKRAWKFR
jgi:hypothetical protein